MLHQGCKLSSAGVIFVAKKSCRSKHMFVLTKHIFCHDKSMLVVRKLLSQQTYFVVTIFFAVTNIILS